MAVVTKRAFIIDCRIPTPLQEYLIPNYIKWNYTINTKFLSVRKQSNDAERLGSKGALRETDFQSYFNHSIEILHRSHDEFYKHLPKNPKYNLPQWRSRDMLLGCTFNFLFKRSERLEHRLKNAKKELGFDKNIVLGIHIRIGDNAAFNGAGSRYDLRVGKIEDTSHFFNCAEKIDELIQRKYKTKKVIWFLASDSMEVKVYAAKKYPQKIKQLYGEIQHIGWPQKGMGDVGYISMFLDLFLLAHSDFRLFTRGNGTISSFIDAVTVASQGSHTAGEAMYKNNVSACRIPHELNI